MRSTRVLLAGATPAFPSARSRNLKASPARILIRPLLPQRRQSSQSILPSIGIDRLPYSLQLRPFRTGAIVCLTPERPSYTKESDIVEQFARRKLWCDL